MNKVKSAEKFLEALSDPRVTMDTMLDRVDVQMLYVINNYAELINKTRDKTEANGVSVKDLVTCSMIIGYLLKSHLDRYELDQMCKNLED